MSYPHYRALLPYTILLCPFLGRPIIEIALCVRGITIRAITHRYGHICSPPNMNIATNPILKSELYNGDTRLPLWTERINYHREVQNHPCTLAR